MHTKDNGLTIILVFLQRGVRVKSHDKKDNRHIPVIQWKVILNPYNLLNPDPCQICLLQNKETH